MAKLMIIILRLDGQATLYRFHFAAFLYYPVFILRSLQTTIGGAGTYQFFRESKKKHPREPDKAFFYKSYFCLTSNSFYKNN